MNEFIKSRSGEIRQAFIKPKPAVEAGTRRGIVQDGIRESSYLSPVAKIHSHHVRQNAAVWIEVAYPLTQSTEFGCCENRSYGIFRIDPLAFHFRQSGLNRLY